MNFSPDSKTVYATSRNMVRRWDATTGKEILLDGNPDTTWSGALAYSPTQDAVQEVSVSVFNTDASLECTEPM